MGGNLGEVERDKKGGKDGEGLKDYFPWLYIQVFIIISKFNEAIS